MTALMAKMKTMSAKPLPPISQAWRPCRSIRPRLPATKPAKTAPDGMVAIPGGAFDFRVQGIEVEGRRSGRRRRRLSLGKFDPGASIDHQMAVHPFFIDTHNGHQCGVQGVPGRLALSAERRPANFLKDWKNGAYPDGWADKPVTWVSLEDARAYAAWAGKRLPHEWEWQYAAQGADGRVYPWGHDMERRCGAQAQHRAQSARARRHLGASRRRQSVRGDGSGGQCLAVDRRIYGRAYALGASCAAAAITSRKVRSGISRMPTATTSTANIC